MTQKYQFICHSDFEFNVDTSVLSLESAYSLRQKPNDALGAHLRYLLQT
jgi:hypothetical protein